MLRRNSELVKGTIGGCAPNNSSYKKENQRRQGRWRDPYFGKLTLSLNGYELVSTLR